MKGILWLIDQSLTYIAQNAKSFSGPHHPSLFYFFCPDVVVASIHVPYLSYLVVVVVIVALVDLRQYQFVSFQFSIVMSTGNLELWASAGIDHPPLR